MTPSRLRLSWLSAALAVGLVAAPVRGQAPTAVDEEPIEVRDAEEVPPDEPNVRRVRFDLSLLSYYDDNVLNLRDDAKTEFQSGDFEPDRFLIDSVDDVVWRPEMRFSFSSTPVSRKTHELGLRARATVPTDNGRLGYEQFQLYFRQDLTDTRPEIDELKLEAEELAPRAFQTRRRFLVANRSRLRLAYHWTDGRYVGQLYDDDAGDRKAAVYDLEAWEVRYRQRLNRGEQNRLQLLLRYVLEDRDYNLAFDERDSEAERYTVGLNLFHLLDQSYWALEGYYEFMDLESNTALIGTEGPGGTVQDDLSSERDLFGLRVGLNWFRERGGIPLGKANRARLGAVWAVKDYTTLNRLDLTHFGREDEAVRLTFDYTHAVRDDTTLELILWYADQESDRFIADRLETSTFDEFRIAFGVNFYSKARFD